MNKAYILVQLEILDRVAYDAYSKYSGKNRITEDRPEACSQLQKNRLPNLFRLGPDLVQTWSRLGPEQFLRT